MRLRKNQRGATIIEFALVLAPFVALIFAILQTALIFFADQTLETANQSVARLVLTGKAKGTAAATGMSQADFKTAACDALPKFMDCTKLMVDVKMLGSDNASFATASAAPTTTYDANGVPTGEDRYDVGKPGEIVMVRLSYPWNVVGAPGLNLSSMTNGQYLLVATTIAKSEPFE